VFFWAIGWHEQANRGKTSTQSMATGTPLSGDKTSGKPLSWRTLMRELYGLYLKLGNERFSEKICEIVPYFATIAPQFIDLRPGYAAVSMPNRHAVHNHLGTVHAIAMCNLAEIAAGLMADVSVSDSSRWIPTGMQVQYLAKAKTDLQAVADGLTVDWENPGDKDLPVSIIDAAGVEVCRAVITIRIDSGQ
jgi:acyl-coenzyme A thioesterase PaaI-like protein